MKVSIVTISYNQVAFLKECIDSVLLQDYQNIEYIVVDPGSTDGSRELIESYGNKIVKLFEADLGPADGLNNGFELATGQIYGFINSDDYLLPGAISEVVEYFIHSQAVDVVSGNSLIVGEDSQTIRRFYSDSMGVYRLAYQGVILSQPSTFFNANIFRSGNKFNIENKSNWDGELFSDFALAGAKFDRLNVFLSAYRLQNESITATGRLSASHDVHLENMFQKIMQRDMNIFDFAISRFVRLVRKALNPRDTLERIRFGPIFHKGD